MSYIMNTMKEKLKKIAYNYVIYNIHQVSYFFLPRTTRQLIEHTTDLSTKARLFDIAMKR